MSSTPYRFYYWPEIPGRGEYVRLAFEAAGVAYEEVVRSWDELQAPMWTLEGQDLVRPPLAPPFLECEGEVIGQTANILEFLGPRLGLVPEDAASRRWVNQLQLSLMDWATEIHDTHHPVAPELYYEAQKTEALRRCAEYLQRRQPKYLAYLEGVLVRSQGPWLLGSPLSYADLSLFFMLEGLAFAFPRSWAATQADYPRLRHLQEGLRAHPRVGAYWASPRRRPFGDGLFRHYPELDALGA